MTQLALLKDGKLVSGFKRVAIGVRFTLPDGRLVMGAGDGWQMDGYALKVVRTPTVPSGKRLTKAIKMISGKPTYVLEDIPAIPRRTIGDFREFMDLFTPGEQLAIAAASQQSPQIKLWYDRAMGGDVPLDHPDTIAGVGALVTANLITQEAHDAVLSADYNAGKTTRVDN
ncbi:MAG: hypothetical protein AAF234_15920 [Pseudomonadota bacterium]